MTNDHGARAHALRNMSSGDSWLECALWVQFKRQQERGEIIIPEQDTTAADRGTRLHEAVETMLRKMIRNPDTDQTALVRSRLVTRFDEHDRAMLLTAFHASMVEMRKAGWPAKGVHVGLEVSVTLTHEPESKAHVDLAIVAPPFLGVYDHKFGRGSVEPDSTQNKGYAANLLHALEARGMHFKEVALGIIQPEDSDDANVIKMTPAQLHRFRAFVEETVARQEDGTEQRTPATSKPCTYCAFKLFKSKDGKDMACPANQRMILDALDDTEAIHSGEADVELVDRFMRSKKMIEETLAQARTMILNDPERFPKWTRTERKNPRGWDFDKADEAEIAHFLRTQLDCREPYRLKTPAQIAKDIDADADFESLLTPVTYTTVLKAKG